VIAQRWDDQEGAVFGLPLPVSGFPILHLPFPLRLALAVPSTLASCPLREEPKREAPRTRNKKSLGRGLNRDRGFGIAKGVCRVNASYLIGGA